MQALAVPNLFTPNGDGVNDVFELRLQYPRTAQLQVFNRWGHLVFRTDTYGDFWQGQDAAARVYYYLWRYTTECDPTEHVVRGSVAVVRSISSKSHSCCQKQVNAQPADGPQAGCSPLLQRPVR